MSVYNLPNEILVTVLTTFSSRNLLPVARVSRRFHSLVLRILHFRLLLAAELPDYKVILEAYHPSRKYTEPYLFCTYLGTDGLDFRFEGEGSLYEDCNGCEGKLAKLDSVYSRFRPERPGVQGSMPVRRIAGAAPAQSVAGHPSQPIYANGGDGGTMKISYMLNLDAEELFTQFCAYASLVRIGPRRGVFLSTVNIVKSGEGVMRVWKDWLSDRARELVEAREIGTIEDISEISPQQCPPVTLDKSILWTDYKRNVGLRVAIRDRQRLRSETAQQAEDLPMSFSVDIKELVVRTTHLMLAVETSQHDRTGKALIFGSFATAVAA